MQTLSAWLRALPEAMLRTRPQLSIMYAWNLADMRDLRGAEEQLQHAEAAPEASPGLFLADETKSARAMIGAGRAVISVTQGDADGAIGQAQAALVGLDNANVRAQSIARIALGLAHLSQGAVSRAALALAAVGEACAHRMVGALDFACATYEEAILWSRDRSQAFLLAGSLYTGLANILRERNELDVALERVT